MLRMTCKSLGLVGFVLLGCATWVVAQPQVEPELVTLTARDSVRTVSSWYARNDDAPVVILLHNAGTSSANFRPLIMPMYRAGFQVLAMDLRGHGRSRDLDPEVYEAMRNRDTRAYIAMQNDVEAAIDWLQNVKGFEPERIAFVGGQFGSTLAIQAMARHPRLGAVVALSPSRNYFRVDIMDFMKDYGNRPLYLILPKQLLSRGAQDVEKVMADNPQFAMKVFPRADLQGVDLLGTTWYVEKYILEWLREVYQMGSS
jgi:alpha-beta hydrolase superfamily lysophospholipase